MVFAFIIHSLTEPASGGVPSRTAKDSIAPPTSVDVYFSFFYEKISGEDSDALALSVATAVARSHWQQVQYEKPFQTPFPFSKSQAALQSPSKAAAKHMKDSKSDGVFYLPPTKGTDSPKFVLWRREHAIAYTIVCYPDENRLLAGQFLKSFPIYFSEQQKSPTVNVTTKEIFGRPDDLLLVLHQYLPGGQLMFLSDEYSKQLKREADATTVKT